jgi:hypothetical protein
VGEFIYLLIGLNALKGPDGIIQSFSILGVFQLINPGLFPVEIHTYKWFVLLCTTPFPILYFIRGKNKSLTRYTLYFALGLVPTGILSSQQWQISGLKYLSFFLTLLSIGYAFEQTQKSKQYWTQWFQYLFLIFLCASYAIFLTDFGYLRNGRGFQGILNHPQALGVFAGIMVIWFLFRHQSSGKNIHLLFAFLSLLLILLSLARIGLLIMLGGWLIHWINSMIHEKSLQFKNSSFKFFFILAGISFFSFLFWENSHQWLKEFMLKRTIEKNLSDSFLESRGKLITSSIYNFKENPLTGIGLGIGNQQNNTVYLHEIPISSPVEKGFMPTALMEEIGILGTCSTILFLLLIYKSIRPEYTLLFWGSLFINLGEFIFFAIGGLGLIQWLMIFYAAAPIQDAQLGNQ